MPLVRVYHARGMTKAEALDAESVADFKAKVAYTLKCGEGTHTLSKVAGGTADDFALDALCGDVFKRGLKLYFTVR